MLDFCPTCPTTNLFISNDLTIKNPKFLSFINRHLACVESVECVGVECVCICVECVELVDECVECVECVGENLIY